MTDKKIPKLSPLEYALTVVETVDKFGVDHFPEEPTDEIIQAIVTKMDIDEEKAKELYTGLYQIIFEEGLFE